jgi:predicted class III extradiol MEMO1 family dioxygenase
MLLASLLKHSLPGPALRRCETKMDVVFTRYEQSHACEDYKDSSVSYASAVVF